MRERRAHEPVMIGEAVAALALRAGGVAVDATVGCGGHAAEIVRALGPAGRLIGIDRDAQALAEARKALADEGEGVAFVHGRMGDLDAILARAGVARVDAILADLGVSSLQLDDPSRGMSFRSDAPLDLRMDQGAGESAAELLAGLDAEEVERILREYGEERHARRIARAIAAQRIRTTGELAAAVAAAVPARERHPRPPRDAARRGGRERIHPATRTFQALRIAVNDELGELDRFLASAPRHLAPGGRLVVLSYHSLEDRRVKHAFRALAASGDFELVTRKALRPGAAELARNPRSRSAKLRVLARLPERR